jgi:hypothetical protein
MEEFKHRGVEQTKSDDDFKVNLSPRQTENRLNPVTEASMFLMAT